MDEAVAGASVTRIPEFAATSFPIRVFLVRNKHQCDRLFKEWEVAYRFEPAHAAVYRIMEQVYVVQIMRSFHDQPIAWRAGALAHEATHLWQHIAADIGETRPGAETEAYTVQALVEWMWKIVIDGAVN